MNKVYAQLSVVAEFDLLEESTILIGDSRQASLHVHIWTVAESDLAA